MNSKNDFKVVVVGRPNVGKSTLFNRLIGRRRSLVHDLPGVTRDRIEGQVDWWYYQKKYSITVTDTGGMGGEHFAEEIAAQVHAALESADLVLFLLDGQSGLTPQDRSLYVELKRAGVFARIPVIGVVNKVDVDSHESRISDFYQLSWDLLLTISAEHGRGVDDLKNQAIETMTASALRVEASDKTISVKEETNLENEEVLESISDDEESAEAEVHQKRLPRIAIIGRPNVGKSTLLNAVFGENRVITSPIAGTTVDSVDTLITHGGQTYCLVDTAGIRRKNKTEEGIEVLSVVQAKKALDQADLAILVLDGQNGLTDQDEKIGGMVEEAGCSVILLMNKWDTQKKNQEFTKEAAAERIRGKMAFLKYAPIVFASAINNEGLEHLWDLVEDILHQRKYKISTHDFTEWVRQEATIHNPMNAKFYMCHQSGRNPPTFVCHVNNPDKIHFSLKRHLINALREKWGYMGTPIRMVFVEGTSGRPKPRA